MFIKKSTKIFSLVTLVGLLGVIGYTSHLKLVSAASCAPNCSVKEVGTIDSVSGRFIATSALDLNKEYWLRLTIKGQEDSNGNSTGNDIMLLMDGSGSMSRMMRRYNDPKNKEEVGRYQAAQRALDAFVSDLDDNPSDGSVDYAGLGNFSVCAKHSSTTNVPAEWVYEEYNLKQTRPLGNSKEWLAYGILNYHLQSIAGKKNLFSTTINNLFRNNGDDTTDCLKQEKGTPVGAGITTANTQLTNILNTTKGSAYKNSAHTFIGSNPGPATRAGAAKYIVIATDGEETANPYAYEEDIDGTGRTTIQTAIDNGIKIYTLRVGGEPEAVPLLMKMAKDTGGEFYDGTTEEQLINSYTTIKNGIKSTSGIKESTVTINEKINETYFKITEPSANTTFRITKQNGSGETAIQDTICSGLSCISNKKYTNSNLISLDIKTDSLNINDTRYIYLKVTPFKSGTGVEVDNDTSKLNYNELNNTAIKVQNLDNQLVTIKQPAPFFQTSNSGNVYSHSTSTESIKVELPQNTRFVESGKSIIESNGNTNFSNGSMSSNGWNLKPYAITSTDLNYDTWLNIYHNKVNQKNITGVTSFNQSGFYLHQDSINRNNLVIEGTAWRNKIISNKNIVVFIPGDLYINDTFNITKGTASLIFIVKGSIGISPTVTEINGGYFADGTIDTACSSVNQFSGTACASTPLKPTTTLTLNGIYKSGNGFILDRTGTTPGTTPGEKFIFRPDLLISAGVTLGKDTYSWKENNE